MIARTMSYSGSATVTGEHSISLDSQNRIASRTRRTGLNVVPESAMLVSVAERRLRHLAYSNDASWLVPVVLALAVSVPLLITGASK